MIVKLLPPPQNYLISAILIIAGTIDVFCQELPPIPVQVQVNTAQFLILDLLLREFQEEQSVWIIMVFAQLRRHYLINFGPSPSSALFDLTANPGTMINIMTPSNVLLTGSNGGQFPSPDSYSTGQVFLTVISPPATTPVFVGEHFGNRKYLSKSSRKLQGVINVTFIQE